MQANSLTYHGSYDQKSASEAIRILHIDDDPSVCEISKLILTDLDKRFSVDSAYSVAEALEKIEKSEYDVYVCDYEMPEKNGLDLLKALNEEKRKNQSPFILFTGKGREEVAIEALNLGAAGYYNKHGSPETVYGELAHGIDSAVASQRARIALGESEEKFRKAFETSPDACYLGTLSEGKILEVNDAFVRMWGYSREECVGKTSLELGMYENGAPDRHRMLREVRSKGHFHNLEFSARRKNGEIFPMLFSGSILKLHGVELIYGVIRDVSEIKKAEVRHSTEMGAILASARSSIFAVDKEYRYSYFNEYHKGMMKKRYGVEVKVGKSTLECVANEEDRVGIKANIDRALSGETVEYEGPVGNPAFLRSRIFARHYPIRYPNGEIVGVSIFVTESA